MLLLCKEVFVDGVNVSDSMHKKLAKCWLIMYTVFMVLLFGDTFTYDIYFFVMENTSLVNLECYINPKLDKYSKRQIFRYLI